MLYKALAADLKSSASWGNGFGPWVKNTWYEIEGPLSSAPVGATNGFHCSDDILYCMYPLQVQYLCQVETEGQSIIRGKLQAWQRMRVVSVKAWPPSKSNLVLDWAEGRAHDWWAGYWPTEAATYDTKHYQGQYADMIEVIAPLWRSLFTNGETIQGLARLKNVHKLKPEYTPGKEKIVRLAYILALALHGDLTLANASAFVQMAEEVRPGSWETVRGFTEDHWTGLPEV